MARLPAPGDSHYNLLWKIVENTAVLTAFPRLPASGDTEEDLTAKIVFNTFGLV